jgi:hypothetical protein
MIVLGLSGALTHDPSAALFINGKLVAAAEEERFIREKHAKRKIPYYSAKFCIEQGGISPKNIDCVAFPFAPIGLLRPDRWHFARRYWYAPDRAFSAIFDGNRHFRRNRRNVFELMDRLGIDKKTPFVPVEHHLAHASSAYHLKKKRRSWESTVKVNMPPPFSGTAKTALSIRSKNFMIPIRWEVFMEPSHSISGLKCLTASLKSWGWRRTEIRINSIFRASSGVTGNQ